MALKSGVYLQLAPVLFGSGTIKELGNKCKELGWKKVMVVTDQGVAKVGHDAKAANILKSAGLEVVIWANALPEVPDYNVLEGAAFARAEKVDGLVGVGGGSSLDCCKCVAVVAPNGDGIVDDVIAYLTGQKKYAVPPLPQILIPTTAGTGSECTFVAVITHKKLNQKIGLPSHSSFNIIDPELTLGTPNNITAACGLDAFSHAAEALTEVKNTVHSDLLAYEAMRLVAANLRKACSNPMDLEAREYLAVGSNFAGISFSESGVHMGHSIAHALGFHHHIPHGVACALVTPPTIEFAATHYPEKIKAIAGSLGIPAPSGSPAQIGKVVADEVRKLMKDVDIPSVGKLNVSREQLLDLAQYVDGEPLCTTFAGPVTRAEIDKALASMYDDYK
ncbi:MAG: iron-containing alcohol dehydrogenase [Deltaproteobacteria bacterium]|jgi:alcohol dehydrogenase|nr:iron-containing alcohol dehydrogenase [Deltaproteobacteria bacterium]